MNEEEYMGMQQKFAASQTSPDDEYAAQIREERVRTLLTEIDPDNLLDSIEYRLKGFKYDKNKRKWVQRVNSKQVPEELVNKVISLLSATLNLNTTFSNLQTNDVNRIMGFLIDIVISDLVVNGHKYEIHDDFSEKERICFIIFGTVYFCLRRAINGTEARRFFGSLRMLENISPQKKSWSDKTMEALQIYK